MERQPDFANQKSALKEIVEGSGHKFELYPKYHCECNWIKRYWGAAKKEARHECDYSFQSLNRKINSFLDSVCPPEDDVPEKIRRYFHKSFAYINAYSLGHDAEHAFEIVKQFLKLHKSHHCIIFGKSKSLNICTRVLTMVSDCLFSMALNKQKRVHTSTMTNRYMFLLSVGVKGRISLFYPTESLN
ncbi:hypothetical protein PHYBLDRAFT_72846 [Phycomyces blakesleeanus NRRL 1555(-)]|uniref:Uncharacterized protein n=1 Tax=Phycomyces blakesleeanus (strain ATCC 8743b / DSM 1359 / FGSC 10004 / NBRC 33097 / NRRL 1555) TaxID=763407 RepID=A0A167M456_PHYB8|nr:hypothetical protein PHYBLDRAFT_72846 [Phycomyces blakesleeanus NRRL 1555(-)]OAD71737.1 hypothetical protein PHYBLDRAFT_72846 [Phycomyces blakesleeanus NRRL 1555(-)]|eukprot:XP_018289777.1 hypothetical protein PHYBLDRAFT_72846 [Phycomyces blakesleeanus NRRL 1555(-)]